MTEFEATSAFSRPASVDGVIHRTTPSPSRKIPSPSASAGQPANKATGPAKSERPFYTPAPPKRVSRWERFQTPLILLGGMIGGFMIQNTTIGVIMILAYGISALIFRIQSRTTFALAALSVAAITVMLLVKPNAELASNFTTYTFLLLVIGVITLIIEGRPPKRRKRNRRLN
jgi:hypothetical protein